MSVTNARCWIFSAARWDWSRLFLLTYAADHFEMLFNQSINVKTLKPELCAHMLQWKAFALDVWSVIRHFTHDRSHVHLSVCVRSEGFFLKAFDSFIIRAQTSICYKKKKKKRKEIKTLIHTRRHAIIYAHSADKKSSWQKWKHRHRMDY